MPLENYHEVEITINGSKMLVGGFKKPEYSSECVELKTKHGIGAVINLRGEGTDWNEKYAKQLNHHFYRDWI